MDVCLCVRTDEYGCSKVHGPELCIRTEKRVRESACVCKN